MRRGDATTEAARRATASGPTGRDAAAPTTGPRQPAAARPATPAGAERRRPRGATLLELTVSLSLAVTVALLVLPSISDLVTRYRQQRAFGDCQTLATAIADFHHDNGFLPTRYENPAASGWPAAGQGTAAARVLATEGTRPDEPVNAVSWLNGPVEAVGHHLVVNGPGYPVPTPLSPAGWRGPYLRTPVGPDPWGRQYLVNIGASEARTRSLQGDHREATTWGAIWALSAGPNGLIETAFEQSSKAAVLGGDDIGVRVR